MDSVYCTERAEFLNIIQVNFPHRIYFIFPLHSDFSVRNSAWLIMYNGNITTHTNGSWKSSLVIADGMKVQASHEGLE